MRLGFWSSKKGGCVEEETVCGLPISLQSVFVGRWLLRCVPGWVLEGPCQHRRRSELPPTHADACECRAQAILALLRDEARLAAEREAHQKKRGAYTGFSSYDVTAQGGGNAAVAGAQEGQGGWQATAQV